MPNHSVLATKVLAAEDVREMRVGIYIDGVSLIDCVREFERPLAIGDGVEALAGNYTWPLLSPHLLGLLAGDRVGERCREGTLLNCPCGHAGCWPLAMRVRVQSRIVVWERFCQLRRADRWGYEGLSPIRFAGASYAEEISKLGAAYEKTARLRELNGLRSTSIPAVSCAL